MDRNDIEIWASIWTPMSSSRLLLLLLLVVVVVVVVNDVMSGDTTVDRGPDRLMQKKF